MRDRYMDFFFKKVLNILFVTLFIEFVKFLLKGKDFILYYYKYYFSLSAVIPL